MYDHMIIYANDCPQGRTDLHLCSLPHRLVILFRTALALGILAFMAAGPNLYAQNGFTLNSSASYQGGACFELTPNNMNDEGSAMNNQTIDLTQPFDKTFGLYFGTIDATGADGIAFVLHTDPLGPAAFGGQGHHIGYVGIANCLAVEFDTHFNNPTPPQNVTDIAADHIAVVRNGDQINNAAGPIAMTNPATNVEDNQCHTGRITWDPVSQNLTIFFDGVQRLVYNFADVSTFFGGAPTAVFWGFTAGTATFSNTHRVTYFDLPNQVSICEGQTAQLNISLDNTQGVSYNWTPATGLSCTTCPNPIASPTTTTTYTATVTHAGSCCPTSRQVTVEVESCCVPEGYDQEFTIIDNSNNVISANAVWKGKYWVQEDVTVQAGVNLDLTNVDIFFEEGTGMTFEGTAHLRANNSVFRPCNEFGSWDGFLVRLGATVNVNECIFKNADIGLDFDFLSLLPPTPFGDFQRITENEFLNNRIAINAAAMEEQGAQFVVVGNSFINDNLHPAILSSPIIDVYGIVLVNLGGGNFITQNHFINNVVLPERTGLTYGIFSNNSSLSAQKNWFSDVPRCFEVTSGLLNSAGIVVISSNVIDFNQRFQPLQSQPVFIRVSDTDNLCYIQQNQINSDLVGTGIYVANTPAAILLANEINACFSAVQMYDCHSALVRGNAITDLLGDGIYMENCFAHMTVEDNSIEYYDRGGPSNAGIYYRLTDLSGYNSSTILIHSNCVFNAATSILLATTSELGPALPDVKNNYLYDYTHYGIYNDRFTGSIGVCTNYSTSGRNTFVSNHLPSIGTAYDIYSTVTISAGCNWGASVVFNVNLSTTPAYNSTADCGHQIVQIPTTPNPDLMANRIREQLTRMYPLLVDGEHYTLASGALSFFSELDEALRLDYAQGIMSILFDNAAGSEAERFHRMLLESSLLGGSDAQWFDYYFQLANTQYDKAAAILKALRAVNADELDLRTIETIRLTQLQNGRSPSMLDAVDIRRLSSIDQQRGRYADVARDLLQVALGGHDYIFRKPVPFTADDDRTAPALNLQEEFVSLSPNPAEDVVSLAYYLADAVGAQLRIIDYTGRVLFTQALEHNASRLSLAVDHLPAGAYTLSVSNAQGTTLTHRFVKY